MVEIELADSSDSLSSEVRCWPRLGVDVAVYVENRFDQLHFRKAGINETSRSPSQFISRLPSQDRRIICIRESSVRIDVTDNLLNVPDESVHDSSIAVERVSWIGTVGSSKIDEVVLRPVVVFVCEKERECERNVREQVIAEQDLQLSTNGRMMRRPYFPAA